MFQGSVLVFKVAVEDNKRMLKLVAKKEVTGAVYSLKGFQGAFFAPSILQFNCMNAKQN